MIVEGGRGEERGEEGREIGEWGKGKKVPVAVSWFSKQTSNAESAWDVNAILVSPAISLGRPYSLPTASLICGIPPFISLTPTNAPKIVAGN